MYIRETRETRAGSILAPHRCRNRVVRPEPTRQRRTRHRAPHSVAGTMRDECTPKPPDMGNVKHCATSLMRLIKKTNEMCSPGYPGATGTNHSVRLRSPLFLGFAVPRAHHFITSNVLPAAASTLCTGRMTAIRYFRTNLWAT